MNSISMVLLFRGRAPSWYATLSAPAIRRAMLRAIWLTRFNPACVYTHEECSCFRMEV